ncbi:E3 ubiquitin-protein ligase RNF213 [Frankliniella fusca]|uniref:E3 ubiquitin-protein ligase RNF213 n=1 Tax=Frankliniella fusca TaxID=407009 RepID=A0AAE1LBD6_9NEOP|nr:E3 ubiquitin-protein ligase RNF213 [Frankliniella fusca]
MRRRSDKKEPLWRKPLGYLSDSDEEPCVTPKPWVERPARGGCVTFPAPEAAPRARTLSPDRGPTDDDAGNQLLRRLERLNVALSEEAAARQEEAEAAKRLNRKLDEARALAKELQSKRKSGAAMLELEISPDEEEQLLGDGPGPNQDGGARKGATPTPTEGAGSSAPGGSSGKAGGPARGPEASFTGTPGGPKSSSSWADISPSPERRRGPAAEGEGPGGREKRGCEGGAARGPRPAAGAAAPRGAGPQDARQIIEARRQQAAQASPMAPKDSNEATKKRRQRRKALKARLREQGEEFIPSPSRRRRDEKRAERRQGETPPAAEDQSSSGEASSVFKRLGRRRAPSSSESDEEEASRGRPVRRRLVPARLRD